MVTADEAGEEGRRRTGAGAGYNGRPVLPAVPADSASDEKGPTMKRLSRLAPHCMLARLRMLAPLSVLALLGVLAGLILPRAGAQERQELGPPPGWPELPSGEVEVTVLEPTTASRFVELTEKLQAGLADKQEWLAGYRRNSRAGQPLAGAPHPGVPPRGDAPNIDGLFLTIYGCRGNSFVEFRGGPYI